MTIDERSRHQLFARLEEVLGSDEATTLMEHLPPLGWADVATKRDLDQLAVITKHELDQLRLDIDRVEQRVTATFRGELVAQTRTIIFALLGTVIAMGGVTIAAVRLA
jgi:hypothetical protein